MNVPAPAPNFCVSVGPDCPVEGTLYGYYPSLGANAFFAAFFGLCLVANIVLGIRFKTWTYMIALGFGCLGELIGYIGRLMLYNNPFSNLGFEIQICCLIISPAFVSAGLYLTLKHIVLSFGEEWSRLRPVWYTRIFIAADIFSLVLQGAGGGIAATANHGSSAQNLGTNLMIAGVIWQVVCLAVFGICLVDYAIRTNRRRDHLSVEATILLRTTSFRLFLFAIVTAYTTVFVRCVYRIPELAYGWRSEIMRNQAEFIVLEGVMIVIAVLVLTVFHPGFCFPALGNTIGKNKGNGRKTVDDSSDMEMVSGR